MQEKGTISIHTENIFPIIKKFLYSDHEIFLRELVSNAVDATQKIKRLATLGQYAGELGDLTVEVSFDEKKKTITISDKGLGMTAEEIKKYINQIAFSGATEFVEKFKDSKDANEIIGKFGLGFYSAFMVAKNVDIHSLSYQEGAEPTIWTCDGSTEFEIKKGKKKSRGTDIILHINEDSIEFLDKWKLQGILDKYCKFLPIPIKFGTKSESVEDGVDDKGEKKWKSVEVDNILNTTAPIWTKSPSDLQDEDYLAFYKSLYPMGDDPLFWIHLNVDYPFNLTGILYFPKIKQSYEIQKDKIQLYSNQVFVTDEVKDIVPEFLMLLQGVIDSPDIPLNVSRSYLQGDPNVRKINSHITKKVADKLEEIFKVDRPSFEEKWESLGLFVKYGMMTDDKFLEKANKFLILQSTEGKFYTFEEYKMATETLQKNKEGKQVILYSTDPIQQDAFIQQANANGYVVLKMETIIDNGFVNQMEMKWENVQFVRVDSDLAENLIDKQVGGESVLSKEEEATLKELFGIKIPDLNVTVEVKGLSTTASPVVATRPEFMRRMKDMAGMGGGGMTAFYAQMPDEVHLTVNGNHPIFQTLLKEPDVDKQQKQARNLADLALLSQGLLKGAELTNFINRSVDLLK